MPSLLTIIHEPDAGPGVFSDVIMSSGADVTVWDTSASPEPPAEGDPAAFSAILTFGGSANPDQDASRPWMVCEKRLLAAALGAGTPMLGVCLGAQLIAAAAGAQTGRAAAPEIGWYPLTLTEEGAADPLIAPFAGIDALEWHGYRFALPPDAIALARSEACLQAYRIGRAVYGIQFHAEVSAADLEHWIEDRDADPDAAGLDPDRFRAENRRRLEAWHARGRALCAGFLKLALDR